MFPTLQQLSLSESPSGPQQSPPSTKLTDFRIEEPRSTPSTSTDNDTQFESEAFGQQNNSSSDEEAEDETPSSTAITCTEKMSYALDVDPNAFGDGDMSDNIESDAEDFSQNESHMSDEEEVILEDIDREFFYIQLKNNLFKRK